MYYYSIIFRDSCSLVSEIEECKSGQLGLLRQSITNTASSNELGMAENVPLHGVNHVIITTNLS